MKKSTALFLAGVMALMLLSGCNGTGDQVTETTRETEQESITAAAEEQGDETDAPVADAPVETTEAQAEINADPPAPPAGNVLEGDKFYISIADGWTEDDSFGLPMLFSPDGMSNINVLSESVPSSMSFDDYIEVSVEMLEAAFGELDVKTENVKIGSSDGIKLAYEVADYGVVINQYMVLAGGEAIIITYTSFSGDEYINDVNTMIGSFTIK